MEIAIVGCGMIADTHVKEIRKIKNAKIVAACDNEPLMAEQLCERYGIAKSYSSMGNMFYENDIDVVHLLTPPTTHYELACKAFEAGCHVLIEKPFVVSAGEAVNLIDKAKRFKKKVTVNHFYSFCPPQMEVKSLVREGRIGNIIHIEGQYGYSLEGTVPQALLNDTKSWLYALPGKIIQNNIDHLLCTILDILPDEDYKISALAHSSSPEAKKHSDSKVFDELRAMLIGETTSAFAIFSSSIKPRQHFMKIYGSKSILTVDYEARSLTFSPENRLPGAFGKLASPFVSSWGYFCEGVSNSIKFLKNDYHFYAGASRLFRDFYSAVENDSEPPIPYKKIVRISEFIDTIFEQVNLG
jgi:predicted dehydrogenase